MKAELPRIEYDCPEVLNKIQSNEPIMFLNVADSIEFNNQQFCTHSFYGVLEGGRKAHLFVEGILLYFDVLIGDMEDYTGPMNVGQKLPEEVPDHFLINREMPEIKEDSNLPKYGHLSCEERIKEPAVNKILREKLKENIEKIEAILITFDQDCDLIMKKEIITRFPGDKFQQFPSLFYRIYFAKYQSRAQLINVLTRMEYLTYMDEKYPSNIVYGIARNYSVSLASWNIIQNYKFTKDGEIYRIVCDIHDIRRAKEVIEPPFISANSIKESKFVIHDFDIETMTFYFDMNQKRVVPKPENNRDFITMIGGTFAWAGSHNKPWYKFCVSIIDYPRRPIEDRGDVAIFVCATEREMLLKYIEILAAVKPSIINGFNSANYDLPFIINRCKTHGILSQYYAAVTWEKAWKLRANDETIMSKKYVSKTYKIKAQNNEVGWELSVPGVMFVDTMIIMRRLYPDSERWSLNYFLKKLGLRLKDDMPYMRMFTLIERAMGLRIPPTFTGKLVGDCYKAYSVVPKSLDQYEGQDTLDVILYCIWDAIGCGEIWAKQNIVLAMRQFADLANVNLYNAFTRADSFKCAMLLMAFGVNTHSYGFNLAKETVDGKFSGGDVSKPTFTGLTFDRPMEELDVQSLYPSIMRAFNISGDKLISNYDDTVKYMRRGIVFTHRKLKIGECAFQAYFAWHCNDKSLMGIIPAVLTDLFYNRKAMQAKMKPFAAQIKEINNLVMSKGKSFELYTPAELALYEMESEIRYNYASLDATQAALKRYMNTFYGVAGSETSAIYNLRLAASVTSWGVQLIKSARKLAEENAYWYFYGDTDSLYVSTPVENIKTAILDYSYGRINYEKYCYNIICESQKAADVLKEKLDVLFKKISGTDIIKFSHDTTGYPAILTGKKKYAYLKQENEDGRGKGPILNYTNREVMSESMKVKGLEMIKSGRSSVLQELGNNILLHAFDINEIIQLLDAGSYYDADSKELHTVDHNGQLITLREKTTAIQATVLYDKWADDELVNLRKLRPIAIVDGRKIGVNEVYQSDKPIRRPPSSSDIYYHIYNIIHREVIYLLNSEINPQDFIKTAVYRPDKDNKCVMTFVERMRRSGGRIPNVGERFEYVITLPNNFVDSAGRIIKYSVGDLMEYPEVVVEKNLSINIEHYMQKELKGMLGRFLTYFYPEYDDELAVKHSQKDVETVIHSASSFHLESKKLRTERRKLYIAGRKLITDTLEKEYGPNTCSAFTLEQLPKKLLKGESDKVSANVTRRLAEIAQMGEQERCKKIIEELGGDYEGERIKKSILIIRERQHKLRDQLMEAINEAPKVIDVITALNGKIEDDVVHFPEDSRQVILSSWKNIEEISKLNVEYKEVTDELRDLNAMLRGLLDLSPQITVKQME